MKFWTFQGLGTMLQLRTDGIYIPDFDTEYYKKNCYRLNSYNCILNLYNKKLNQNNKGLIFGISECMGNSINTYEDYKNTLKTIGGYGFSSSVGEIYLLELDIPVEEEYIMPIDFYRFGALIDLMDINTRYKFDIFQDPADGEKLSLIDYHKKHLFESNLINIEKYKGVYELKQVHFPYIKKEYITNIYNGIEYNDSMDYFIESSCHYLNYFKQVLLN